MTVTGAQACACSSVESRAFWRTHPGLEGLIIYNQMVVDRLSDVDADLVFGALADRTRRDVLARTITGEQSVSTLARHYEMSFAAVQKHVAVLERAALVTKERRGREQIVHGNTATLRKATRLLDVYEQLWVQRAAQIAGVLAGEEGGRR